MAHRPETVDDTVAALVSEITIQLAGDGWQPRHLGPGPLAVFTRPLGDGFAAAGEISRVSRSPGRSAVDVALSVGTGYEPATALMPIVTLRPQPLLVRRPDLGTASTWHIRAGRTDEIGAHAAGIVAAT